MSGEMEMLRTSGEEFIANQECSCDGNIHNQQTCWYRQSDDDQRQLLIHYLRGNHPSSNSDDIDTTAALLTTGRDWRIEH